MYENLTFADIQAMTPEQVAALNKELARKLGKKILTKSIRTAAFVGATVLVVKYLESRANEIDTDTSIED